MGVLLHLEAIPLANPECFPLGLCPQASPLAGSTFGFAYPFDPSLAPVLYAV